MSAKRGDSVRKRRDKWRSALTLSLALLVIAGIAFSAEQLAEEAIYRVWNIRTNRFSVLPAGMFALGARSLVTRPLRAWLLCLILVGVVATAFLLTLMKHAAKPAESPPLLPYCLFTAGIWLVVFAVIYWITWWLPQLLREASEENQAL